MKYEQQSHLPIYQLLLDVFFLEAENHLLSLLGCVFEMIGCYLQDTILCRALVCCMHDTAFSGHHAVHGFHWLQVVGNKVFAN